MSGTPPNGSSGDVAARLGEGLLRAAMAPPELDALQGYVAGMLKYLPLDQVKSIYDQCRAESRFRAQVPIWEEVAPQD